LILGLWSFLGGKPERNDQRSRSDNDQNAR